MGIETPPWANSGGSGTYSAEQTRRAAFASFARTTANTPGILLGGVVGAGDLALTPPGSGLSVLVGVGEAIIPGNEGANQGAYYARVTSSQSEAISTANPSNPRIDTIVATISDSNYTEPSGGSGNQWALQVVTGTATSGASLANLNGAGAVPGSSLLIGYVLVPAAATNIISADLATVVTPAVTITVGTPVPVTRVTGTVYQPNLRSPLFVSVGATLSGGAGTAEEISIAVGPTSSPTINVGIAVMETSTTTGQTSLIPITFLLPAAWYYEITAAAGSPTINYVAETPLY